MEVEFQSNVGQVRAELSDDTFQGLVHAAEYLLTVSRTQVPLDEATLERSGAVTQDRNSDTVAVSYDTEYAVRQHEELDWKHAPDRKAKYLEDPVNDEEVKDAMLAIIVTQESRARG